MDNESKYRLLYIGKLLFELSDEEHTLSTANIIELLKERYGIESHRQTVKRDIDILRGYGMDIQEIKSTQNRYNIVSRKFDTAELKLLIDAVESAKFITSRKSQELVSKISSLAGVNQAEALKRNVSVERRIKTSNEKIYLIIDAINAAINSRRKISFQYFQYDVHKRQKLRHDGEAYVLSPLNLVWNGDCYYVLGSMEDGSIRCFRVDRVAGCPEILQEEAKSAPADFDINQYINTTFRMFSGENCTVELECDCSVMDSIIDRFGPDIGVIVQDEQSFKTRVNVSTSSLFYSWVFGFGGLVRILGPRRVRDEYREMVERVSSNM